MCVCFPPLSLDRPHQAVQSAYINGRVVLASHAGDSPPPPPPPHALQSYRLVSTLPAVLYGDRGNRGVTEGVTKG